MTTQNRHPCLQAQAADEDSGSESLEMNLTRQCVNCSRRFVDRITGPDDPRWHLAELLAEAWGPALTHTHHLGRHIGFGEGYARAEADMAAAWRQVYLSVTKVLRVPPFEELQRRRYELSARPMGGGTG